MSDRQMTSREKVLAVEAQIRSMIDGEQTEFYCPFCNLATSEGNGILCCDEAAEVINAVLDHIDFKKSSEIVEKVLDRYNAMDMAPSRVTLN